jgi:hypothetical protein
MQYKIEAATKQLRPLRGSQDQETLYTGLKINGSWVNLKGDHRNLYNKVVDLEIDGNMARFTNPQTPPAPAQQPPAPPPPSTNGHTPKWATRDDAVGTWIFYATKIAPYINDAYAIVKAANCLVMMEKDGEINPVHAAKGDGDRP